MSATLTPTPTPTPAAASSTQRPLLHKVALVTGGSRGIGAAIVEELARQGAHVAFTYGRSKDAAERVVRAAREHETRVEAIPSDASDAAQASRLVADVVERFGRLDILVNNAGVFEAGPIDQFTDEQFEKTFDINVRAVFLTSRAAARAMTEGGRIINISSGLGASVPWPNIAVYAASKFAVNGLTRGMARDLGPRGITVNVVAPGSTDTDMNPDGSDFSAVQKQYTALGRYGRPADIAALVAFVASPAAGNITGAVLTSDGGAGA